MWQIGNEGGFLAAPVNLTADHGNRLLMGLAERADVIVDFTNVPAGNYVLGNVGPDEPFGGGVPGRGLRPSRTPHPPARSWSSASCPPWRRRLDTPPQFLRLPAIAPLPPATVTRPLALIEMMSESFEEAPGRGVAGDGRGAARNVAAAAWTQLHWMDDRSRENPAVGATEVWELYNTTADAHPMHIHEVAFEVVNRQGLMVDEENETACRSSSARQRHRT